MADSVQSRRYHRNPGAAVAMHVTVLQPLLILAAIVIVSGVPLLGAVAPTAAIGASSAVARGAESAATRDCPGQARTPASRRPASVASNPCRQPAHAPACATQLEWAVDRGASALPPPRG